MNELNHILNNLKYTLELINTLKGQTNKTPEQFERSLIAIEDTILYLKTLKGGNKKNDN